MWVEVLCRIDRVWSSKECAYCVCDPSVHLSVPSIGFVYVCVYRKLSFKSLKAGSQVFVLLMLFLCVILHTMWSGKSLNLLCILTFGIVCLSAISIMLKNDVGSVYGGLSESGLCVFRELCPPSFLVVGESPSVLL